MTMSPPFHRLRMAAISLNNTGASLVERQCYNQAIAAFKDAVSVMKAVTATSASSLRDPTKASSNQLTVPSPTHEDHCSTFHIESLLRKASHSLSNPHPDLDPTQGIVAVKIRVLTHDESFAVTKETLRQEERDFESSTSFLIRIETDTCSFINDQGRFLDIESSIMVHNFGSAYRCLATLADTPAVTIQLFQSAFKFSKLSYSILQNCLWHTGSQDNDQGGDLMEAICIIYLQTLASYASALGKPCDAEIWYSRLTEAKSSFLERENSIHEIGAKVAARAA